MNTAATSKVAASFLHPTASLAMADWNHVGDDRERLSSQMNIMKWDCCEIRTRLTLYQYFVLDSVSGVWNPVSSKRGLTATPAYRRKRWHVPVH